MERCFINTLPDYDPQEESEEKSLERTSGITGIGSMPEGVGVNLTGAGRLSLPSDEEFKAFAVALKEEVLDATWRQTSGRVQDPFMYTGTLGTAFLCLRTFEVTGDKRDLARCLEITDACARAASNMHTTFTFLCGQAGIFALGAAAAHLADDHARLRHYLAQFNQMASDRTLLASAVDGGMGVPYELLYGRAGFLYAALFINSYVGKGTVPESATAPVIAAIVEAGRAMEGPSPLMYQWHGTPYWGAAHRLAGICHVLLHFPLAPDVSEDVRGTLRYMVEHRFPGGNYPSSEGKTHDRLVHWCHGAPGVALSLCMAAQVLPEGQMFAQAAVEAGDVVWQRGLLRRLGICHGVSGNAYVFLALYRLTGGKKHLHRARAFASFLKDSWRDLVKSGEMHGGDRPWSLFEGRAGLACLWADLSSPLSSRFPGFELQQLKGGN